MKSTLAFIFSLSILVAIRGQISTSEFGGFWTSNLTQQRISIKLDKTEPQIFICSDGKTPPVSNIKWDGNSLVAHVDYSKAQPTIIRLTLMAKDKFEILYIDGNDLMNDTYTRKKREYMTECKLE